MGPAPDHQYADRLSCEAFPCGVATLQIPTRLPRAAQTRFGLNGNVASPVVRPTTKVGGGWSSDDAASVGSYRLSSRSDYYHVRLSRS
jgi:hypothetical protein